MWRVTLKRYLNKLVSNTRSLIRTACRCLERAETRVMSGANNSRNSGLPENQERALLLRNVPEEIKGLPYFYPKIADSREATIFVGENSNSPGFFLLRLSSKGDDYLALTISVENRLVRHVNVKIERQPTIQYYILEQIKFNAFHELQQFYSSHCICNAEKVKNVKLLHPINRGYNDWEEYAKLNSTRSRSKSIKIPARASTLPPAKTPASQQLTAQLPQEPEKEESDTEDDYLPGAQAKSPRQNRALPSLPTDIPDINPTQSKGDARPPCPLPPNEGEANLYYSNPTDENKNRIDELRDILKSAELCECGIPLADSDLPRGWTLHMSHAGSTDGHLFFQSAAGETTWVLPQRIWNEMTQEQCDVIFRLCHESGRSPSTVRAAGLLANRRPNQITSRGHNSDTDRKVSWRKSFRWLPGKTQG